MFSLLVRMAWEEHMKEKQHTTASGEDYLEAILVLKKKLGMVRSVDVARHLEVTKPSVCHAVATLREGGFLTMDSDYFLHLTDVGREVAEQIYDCLLYTSTRTYYDAQGETFCALDHASLIWEQGHSIAIMGESGSGRCV